jgi:D-alanyl-D-alanine carboxypeptidase
MRIYQSIVSSLVVVFSLTTGVHAATEVPALTAKGIAIYGWKDGVATPILIKNEHNVFPIASLTKIITAKAVEELYTPETIFTISKAAAATEGTIAGIVAGAQFTRDDLLKALLINSSNDAAAAFMEPVGKKTFLAKMNDILHINNYTTTSFVNPSGLDPAKKLQLKPNRMTPYHLTTLLNDVYLHSPLLKDIMGQNNVEITDIRNNVPVTLKQTNSLYRDDFYKDKVVMSKTGLTNLAGQNLAFVTQGTDVFDHVTIVILGSKNRKIDSEKILDWLAINYQQTSVVGGNLSQR